MLSRVCSVCGIEKKISEFHKQSKCRSHVTGGYGSACKPCTNGSNRKYWNDNVERMNIQKKRYRESHREEAKILSRRHYENNKEMYFKKDAEKKRMLRLASLGQNPYTVLKLYKIAAKIMTVATGVKYSVDHIIPLKGKNVLGLNVDWNLRIIPLDENKRKFNKVVGGGLFQ